MQLPQLPPLVQLHPERLLDAQAITGSVTLVVVAVLAAYLQEVVPLLGASLAGADDPRLDLLGRQSLRRSASLIGWLALPIALATLLQVGVVVPVWAFSRRLLDAPLATAQERRSWVAIQLLIVPVLLLLAATLSMVTSVLPTYVAWSATVAGILASAMKQLVLLALLHLVPVPPFALGRGLAWLWRNRRATRIVQSILLAALLADGLTGGRVVGRTLGMATDLVFVTIRLLS